MKPVYFTPGPAELFYTVPDHLRQGLREHIFSINHRSEKFQSVIRHTKEQLREIFQLPEGYRIAFCSSATEIWERISLNLIEQRAGFIVNGAFSGRFAQYAEELGKESEIIETESGQCIDINSVKFSADIELIGITHNETSTGACQPMDDIYKLKDQYPQALVAVDIVSSAPIYAIDFTKIDSAYFSVQKGFGLPAGLGVWIYNERCLEKAISLEEKGKITGSYHKLSRLASKADKNQTPSTPNMMGIYLLGKVAEDMNNKGLDMIRRESRYKSALIYQTILDHPQLEVFVSEKSHRSQTTIVANAENSKKWIGALSEKGLVLGSGYAEMKDKQLRIANFPTHSKEQFERLSDELVKVN